MTSIPSHLGLRIDNKYRIEAELGSGGMATVYRATRLLIGDTVAIKILHPGQVDDRQSVERFRREAEAAARLKHPNAVPIYDFGVSSEGLVYLVMELVEGKTVRDMLREDGPLAPEMAAEIITQVCSALEAAHKKNIVHRDIKPDNIVVDATPAGISVKVLDFGIAWMRDVTAASLTETGNVVGTPHYMSPEQCLGEEPDPRSDIYSMGVVLFEMLAGVVPFNARASTAVVVQHVNQAPPSLRAIASGVSPAVESVVMRALAKRRDQRPQSAALLAAELTGAIRGHVVQSNRASSSAGNVATTVKMPKPGTARDQKSPASSRSSRRLWIWVSAGVVVAGGAAGALVATSREPDTTSGSKAVPPIDSPSRSGSGTVGSADIPSPVIAIDSVEAHQKSESSVVGPPGGVVFTQRGRASQAGTYSTAKAPSPPKPAAPVAVAKKAAAPETRTTETRARAVRDTPVATGTAPTSAAIPNAAPAKVAAKEAAPPNPPTPRPNLATLAAQAAGSCLSALRSNSAERMAQLYPASADQDRSNRTKLLARMSDASSRLTLRGSPEIGPAQTFEDSAYSDLVVRLTWRGNFGQTVTKEARFRATIAQTEGDSHISCRIIGKADL